MILGLGSRASPQKRFYGPTREVRILPPTNTAHLSHLAELSCPCFDSLIVTCPQFHITVLGADRLSDHPFRHGLEVLMQHGLQLEELRPQRRVDVRLGDPDHHGRATLTLVPVRR